MDRRTFLSRAAIALPVLPAAAMAMAEPEVDWIYTQGYPTCPLCHISMYVPHDPNNPQRLIVEHFENPGLPCKNAGKRWELEVQKVKVVR